MEAPPNAIRIEEEVRKHAVRRAGVFPRVTWIFGLVGALLMCWTLFKIPNIDSGYPFLMKHEILYSIAVGIVIAILLNLFFILTVLVHSIYLRLLKKSEPPSEESIQKYLKRKTRTECCFEGANFLIYVLGRAFWVYIFMVGVMCTFVPYGNVDDGIGRIMGSLSQAALYFTVLLKLMVDGFPPSWQ